WMDESMKRFDRLISRALSTWCTISDASGTTL
ncbi:hypothetical protein KIPB_013954, partial [Kipferlia bialata]